jgi:hypothetical protein
MIKETGAVEEHLIRREPGILGAFDQADHIRVVTPTGRATSQPEVT